MLGSRKPWNILKGMVGDLKRRMHGAGRGQRLPPIDCGSRVDRHPAAEAFGASPALICEVRKQSESIESRLAAGETALGPVGSTTAWRPFLRHLERGNP